MEKENKGVPAVGSNEKKEVSVREQNQKKEQKTMKESVYSVDELAASAEKLFGTRRECATAALRSAGRKEYTISEAKEIIKKFLKKEVR